MSSDSKFRGLVLQHVITSGDVPVIKWIPLSRVYEINRVGRTFTYENMHGEPVIALLEKDDFLELEKLKD